MKELLPKSKKVNPMVMLKPLRDELAPRKNFINNRVYLNVMTKSHKSLEVMSLDSRTGRKPFLISTSKLR
jgi:hypothetical protein